jgi:hypothetical protein
MGSRRFGRQTKLSDGMASVDMTGSILAQAAGITESGLVIFNCRLKLRVISFESSVLGSLL